MKRNILYICKWCLGLIIILTLFFFCFVGFSKYKLQNSSPKIPKKYHNLYTQGEGHHKSYSDNWVNKNKYGIWEVFLKGDAFDRGTSYGKLLESPIRYQEEVFVKSINKAIPSKLQQWFLKNLIYLFHTNINNFISKELKNEILGVSLYFSDKYDYIGDKYLRILAYHAAHDLGHALNNYSLVGCTSFSAWGNNTHDNNIIHARNFDFYFGDDFAKEKVLLMIKPDSGHAFVSYSWPGMMGVVSGMNEKGLAITINASASEPPTSANTPISILVREVIQFTKNLEEAINYISEKKIFVSESIMISSAIDNKTIIIEKTPNKQDIFENNELIICSNHFQSNLFKNDSINIHNIKTSDSKKRFKRISSLVNNKEKINVEKAISVLRDVKGNSGKDIGLGVPHAINQLLAHHGIVFEPNKLNVWISTAPYQIGDFICYNLDSIFNNNSNSKTTSFISVINKDTLLNSELYSNYQRWKIIKDDINSFLSSQDKEPNINIEEFINLNKNSYETFYIIGQLFLKTGKVKEANKMFKKSSAMSLPSESIKIKIEKLIKQYN